MIDQNLGDCLGKLSKYLETSREISIIFTLRSLGSFFFLGSGERNLFVGEGVKRVHNIVFYEVSFSKAGLFSNKFFIWFYKDRCFEYLAHRWNIASLDLLFRYYFGRCSSKLALSLLVQLHYFCGSSTFHLINWMLFLPLFLDAIKMDMSTVSFLAQLDFVILCLQNAFSLTSDLKYS